MANKKFRLEIITPSQVVYSKDVTSIVAPASEGYLGILARHAPLMTSLIEGKLKIRELNQSKPHLVYIKEGFLEVLNNKVDILVDKIEIETTK